MTRWEASNSWEELIVLLRHGLRNPVSLKKRNTCRPVLVARKLQEQQKPWSRWKGIEWNYPPHPGFQSPPGLFQFLVGNPYKPSFVTLTGWGVDQRYPLYIYIYIAKLQVNFHYSTSWWSPKWNVFECIEASDENWSGFFCLKCHEKTPKIPRNIQTYSNSNPIPWFHA